MKKTILLAACLLLLPAHSWYDSACCGEKDCNPVPIEDVVEIEDGKWKYLPTGNIFTKDQVKPSKDKNFHVCIGVDEFNKGQSYCIYILQGF